MSNIIVLDTVKNYLKITTSINDIVLDLLISAVSELIENELGRTLIEITYTDVALDGNGLSRLYLPNWPITTLTSVKEDDITLTEGKDKDFRLYGSESDGGYLLKLDGGTWAKGYKNIVVTYKAGYVITSIPKNLQLLALRKIAREWKVQNLQQWGEQSRSFGGESISYNLDNHFNEAELGILRNYKRYLL